MSDEKELKLVVPKSLMVALWVAGIGLVLNGVQSFLSTPANAVLSDVQKVAICDSAALGCANVVRQVDKYGTEYHALEVYVDQLYEKQ